MQGHVLLHSIQSSLKKQTASGKGYEHDSLDSLAMPVDIESLVADSCKMVSSTYGLFKYKTAEQVNCSQSLIALSPSVTLEIFAISWIGY